MGPVGNFAARYALELPHVNGELYNPAMRATLRGSLRGASRDADIFSEKLRLNHL